MITLHTKSEVSQQVRRWRQEGLRVGFVPTMGALHEGHLSLMRLAARHADRVVVSIFVNPTQFGPNEDFARYPRDSEADLAKCRSVGVAAVFLPSVEEIYPADATVIVDENQLSRGLCGASRPGHFRGVLTVVTKLLHIVSPDVAVFGRKDAQQLALIQRMVRDLDFPVTILPGPIVRESDGLALSSRNRYLSPTEREEALTLSRTLQYAAQAYQDGERDAVRLRSELCRRFAEAPGVSIEYVEIVDAVTLAPAATLQKGTLIALAARVGKTRLIDNLLLEI